MKAIENVKAGKTVKQEVRESKKSAIASIETKQVIVSDADFNKVFSLLNKAQKEESKTLEVHARYFLSIVVPSNVNWRTLLHRQGIRFEKNQNEKSRADQLCAVVLRNWNFRTESGKACKRVYKTQKSTRVSDFLTPTGEHTKVVVDYVETIGYNYQLLPTVDKRSDGSPIKYGETMSFQDFLKALFNRFKNRDIVSLDDEFIKAEIDGKITFVKK